MRELALFAGAGGGILGGRLLGWRTVCAVEFDDHARRVLMARQDDGCLEPFPIWDDVSTFDGKPWRGRVDVVSGGFPCQDISIAGKGAGLSGARSGLWHQAARIIREVRPRFAFVENSPALTFRGLGVVLGDLAEMGYDAAWGVLGGRHVGAPHLRERIWIVAADADQDIWAEIKERGMDAPPRGNLGRGNMLAGQARCADARMDWSGEWRALPGAWADPQSRICRVDDGLADRVDRVERLGNGQIPAVAALAFCTLAQAVQEADRPKHMAKGVEE